MIAENYFSFDELIQKYLLSGLVVQRTKRKNPFRDKKTQVYTVRFTKAEKAIIEKKAEGCHSLTDYITKESLKPRSTDTYETRLLIGEFDTLALNVGKVGSIINQFTKYVNQRQEISDVIVRDFIKEMKAYMQLKIEMTRVMKKLLKA